MFEILKFRRMAVGAEAETGPVWTELGDVRPTRVGRVRRRFQLDELPHAINVLKGEMSLVGPRPELAARFGHELPGFGARYHVRPGLAGLAQAEGAPHPSPRGSRGSSEVQRWAGRAMFRREKFIVRIAEDAVAPHATLAPGSRARWFAGCNSPPMMGRTTICNRSSRSRIAGRALGAVPEPGR